MMYQGCWCMCVCVCVCLCLCIHECPACSRKQHGFALSILHAIALRCHLGQSLTSLLHVARVDRLICYLCAACLHGILRNTVCLHLADSSAVDDIGRPILLKLPCAELCGNSSVSPSCWACHASSSDSSVTVFDGVACDHCRQSGLGSRLHGKQHDGTCSLCHLVHGCGVLQSDG